MLHLTDHGLEYWADSLVLIVIVLLVTRNLHFQSALSFEDVCRFPSRSLEDDRMRSVSASGLWPAILYVRGSTQLGAPLILMVTRPPPSESSARRLVPLRVADRRGDQGAGSNASRIG